jgi:hypothetical protein
MNYQLYQHYVLFNATAFKKYTSNFKKKIALAKGTV